MHSDWSCVFLDTETTGLDPKVDRVVSYSLRTWSLDNGKGAEQSALILLPPWEGISVEAQRVNGYDHDLWLRNGASCFGYTHIESIRSMLPEGTILAGSNPRFDYAFLVEEFARLHQTFPKVSHRMIDTGALAAPLLVIGEVKSTSLESLANYFGCNRSGAHTAAGDVDVDTAIEVWESLLRAFLLKE